MKLQLLDPDNFAVLTEDGRVSVVPVNRLHQFLNKELPKTNIPNIVEKMECSICGAIWTDMRTPDELFTNCPECKVVLTLNRQNWRMN